MKRFLPLISLSVLLLLIPVGLTAGNRYALPLPEGERCDFRVSIHFRGNRSLTGIMAIRNNGESIVGTFINEFGIKAFDFKADGRRHKVRLLNVSTAIESRAVRCILRRDIGRLLRTQTDSKRLTEHTESLEIMSSGNRYHLTPQTRDK